MKGSSLENVRSWSLKRIPQFLIQIPLPLLPIPVKNLVLIERGRLIQSPTTYPTMIPSNYPVPRETSHSKDRVLDDQFTSNCQTVCDEHVISFKQFKKDLQNDLKQDWIAKKTDNVISLCDISCPDAGFPPRLECVIQIDNFLKVNIFCNSKSGHLLQEPSFVINKYTNTDKLESWDYFYSMCGAFFHHLETEKGSNGNRRSSWLYYRLFEK